MIVAVCRYKSAMLGILFSVPLLLWSPQSTAKAIISETDLMQITVQNFQLGMDRVQANTILEQHFSNLQKADQTSATAHKCIKNQCQAQRLGAEGSVSVNLHFNQANLLYWISAQTQAQLAGNADECSRLAKEQLAALRQEYSPELQQLFFGLHTVSLRLNKTGHPDPADNLLFGFRVQIKCDPAAKGLAQSEFELRDNAL